LSAEAGLRNLLVIGVDVVSLAASARRAGYRVFAVDHFGDRDLRRICHGSQSIVEQRAGKSLGRFSADFDPEKLLGLTRLLLREEGLDAALLSSGLDDQPDVLSELDDLVPILGNRPEIIGRVRDKTRFFRELRSLGIRHPETALAEGLEEARERSKDIGYPVVVKPSTGFGGVGIRKTRDSRELERAFSGASAAGEAVLVQEYVPGTPASASLISSAMGAVTLTLNEQLLGMCEVGQPEPFGYCGNVVPLTAARAVAESCRSTAERVAAHFGLVGSIGVDMVIPGGGAPSVIEVNPRFQGSLECVERVLGVNVVEAHVEACTRGGLSVTPGEGPRVCTRVVLFAPQRSIAPDLERFEGTRDIPLPGAIVEKGEPLCSIVAEGVSRNSSLRRARATARRICRSLRPSS